MEDSSEYAHKPTLPAASINHYRSSESMATKNSEASGVVWNTAAPMLLHKQAHTGNAASIIEGFLDQAAKAAEEEAIARAGLCDVPTEKRKLKKTSKKAAKPDVSISIEKDDVLADVARAAGPQYPGIQQLPDPNPHWSNQQQAWSHQFTPRLAEALVNAVNLGTERLGDRIQTVLTEHISAIEKRLSDPLDNAQAYYSNVAQSYASSRMRLDVLWWSTARYSPLLRKGYRELHLPIVSLAAAIDVVKIVPPLAPASIAYVLAETVENVRRNSTSANVIYKIGDYLQAFESANLDIQESLLSSASNSTMRMPLIELIVEATSGSVGTVEKILSITGIAPSLEVGLADFSVWIYRGLQARRLVETLR